MSGHDADIDQLKSSVSCAVVLERLPPVWQLDVAESTRRNLKFRRGSGEILIINHDGRGWWDPLSAAKGDIFALVQHLDPSLDFPASRRVVRGLIGLAPTIPSALRARPRALPTIPVVQRWDRRPRLSRDSAAWRYLAATRGLPEPILIVAALADAVREGPQGSAWFAHRDGAGRLTGIEMRGPAWRTFSAGGEKALFRLPGGPGVLPRVTVCEAAIDALSLAALEGMRGNTLYAATAGGMGPATVAALLELLAALAGNPAAMLVAATDADSAGRRLAERLAEIAAEAGIAFAAPLPPDGFNDWNDALCRCQAAAADDRAPGRPSPGYRARNVKPLWGCRHNQKAKDAAFAVLYQPK